MRKSYLGSWLLLLAGAAAATAWVMAGRAFVRRTAFGVPPIAPASRTEPGFLAVLMPHIGSAGGKKAMSSAALRRFIEGLKAAGCVPIELDDVGALYARGRRLPPKAVLLAFEEDDLPGVKRADSALKDERWRGTLFITGITSSGGVMDHPLLTAHMAGQMRLSRAWEFGAVSSAEPPDARAAGGIRALLDDDGRRLPPKNPGLYPVRFAASDLGYNDEKDAPNALRMLSIRPGLTPEQDLSIVADSWPRRSAFADRFAADGFGADWIPGWGTVSIGRGRLALFPTPRQTGAGVFLRGTERWRDAVLEADLRDFRKEFWVYARYAPNGSFVRVGARGRYWYAEQKAGAKSLPVTLARAPIAAGDPPARLRLVVKGDRAIVHVDGRMLFGRALRVNPAVARGRVLLGVYDVRQRSAFALLTSFRARPGEGRWLAWKEKDGSPGFDDRRMDALREEAVLSRAITPRWLTISRDGAVTISEAQGTLIRSLAGYYGCRLIPMGALPAGEIPSEPAGARRLAASLAGAARRLEAPGLNLRLSAAGLSRPGSSRFLADARDDLRRAGRELWITVDGGGAIDPGIAADVDGVLRPSLDGSRDFEILRAEPGAP